MTTADPTDTPPTGDSADPPASVPDTEPRDDREAARYRRRLRDTEAERDTLRTRIVSMQRVEAERIAGQHLADGADLWLRGTQLGDLLNDDGNVCAEKIAAAAQDIGAASPHWVRKSASAAPASEVTANGKIETEKETPSWADLLGGGLST